MGECLYIPFWNKYKPFILESIKSGCSDSKLIDISELQSYSRDGNRQTLRFRVVVEDGRAYTKTNSAIARDLCSVINSISETEIGNRKAVINLIGGNRLNIVVE